MRKWAAKQGRVCAGNWRLKAPKQPGITEAKVPLISLRTPEGTRVTCFGRIESRTLSMNSMRLSALHSCASSVRGPAEPVNPLTPVNWTSAWRTITASHQPRKLKMLLISGNKWILIMQVTPNWSPSLWKFPVTSAWSKRRKYEDLSYWRLFYTLECSCRIGLGRNLEEEWNSFIYTLTIFLIFKG